MGFNFSKYKFGVSKKHGQISRQMFPGVNIDSITNGIHHIIIIDDQNGENEENVKYMQMCLDANPSYRFYFYDEHREGGTLYKNKSLVCIPITEVA